MTENVGQKCGVIALIGAPNAGKSTLLNKLVGSKISIVTPKVQTTRTRVTGIATKDNTQLIFIDTPGIFSPKSRMDKAMTKAAWKGMEGADVVALLVDVKHAVDKNTSQIIRNLQKNSVNAVLILNKIDLIEKPALLEIAARLNKEGQFSATFMVSAENGNGVEDLQKYFIDKVPYADWIYPEDQAADMPMRVFAAEITREKLMLQMHQEIPYKIMVETESWLEKKNSININQIIYVVSDRHKKMVIGKGGQTIKTIGEKSRKELQYLIGKKINLFLFVKIKEDWQESKENYGIMGLEF